MTTGTRLMSGSPARRSRKPLISRSESSIASSMLTSIIWAPLSTCSRATSRAPSWSPAWMSLRKRAEPVTLVRSPTFTKRLPGRRVSGSRPLYALACAGSGGRRGG